MGTETFNCFCQTSFSVVNKVKLNNPQMGTETTIKNLKESIIRRES